MIGVNFGNKHSYTDFSLIMTGRKIGLPSPQINEITIPGRDGTIDITEALDGEVHYGPRTINLTFETIKTISQEHWATLLTRFATYIHGQRFHITFDDDQDWFYIGRCSISNFDKERALQRRKFDVQCNCQPYKLAKANTVVEANINPSDRTLILENGRKPVIPTVVLSCAAIITIRGNEYELSAGTYEQKELKLLSGDNTILVRTAEGVGTVSFTWQKGNL